MKCLGILILSELDSLNESVSVIRVHNQVKKGVCIYCQAESGKIK
mgnify:CR=1 FL=1